MAEGPSAEEAAPLLHGLPDEITVWEILVLLPPKSLLRCRAVCPAWRRATSTRDFLLAHHARQPSLPLLCGYDFSSGDGVSLDVIPFDHRAGLAAADQLQSVARLGNSFTGPEASCDGLLLTGSLHLGYSICNPATRQHARLEEIDRFALLGMYPHSPTGEYRLLLGKCNRTILGPHDSYVYTLGSGQPPRRISFPGEEHTMVDGSSSVLCRGSLHWHVQQHVGASNMIKLFNTTTESFQQMRAPAVPGSANLFEMDGMLGMYSLNDALTTIDIWMTRDYESEAWAFKYRVEVPVAELRDYMIESWAFKYRGELPELTEHFGMFCNLVKVVVMPGDGELLVLVESEDRLHVVDINGKLVASFHHSGLGVTQLRLKQTLVPHTFFPTLKGHVVNDSPFI
uniref:Uncharacterized protein n=1 Tax=Avena sativa TaxID=4498 RepID=A0ACD5WPU0_AVESA